ncbi:unnamed protein product [Agarophyton chilense]
MAHLRAACDPPRAVLPWLWLGGARFASRPFIVARGVSHVLSLCEAREFDVAALAPCNVLHLRVCVRDVQSANVRQHFERCIAFLTHVKATHGVALVHCVAGVSRSVCVVLAFLVWQGYSLARAWSLVRERRRGAAPNGAFWEQLRAWEAEVAHLRACDECMRPFKERVQRLRREEMQRMQPLLWLPADDKSLRACAASSPL